MSCIPIQTNTQISTLHTLGISQIRKEKRVNEDDLSKKNKIHFKYDPETTKKNSFQYTSLASATQGKKKKKRSLTSFPLHYLPNFMNLVVTRQRVYFQIHFPLQECGH